MIAATHGNLVVSVTSGDGFFGLTLREKKLVKTKKMPRRGAGARKRRAEKRLLDRKRSGNENENAEISNLEKDESDKPKLGESPSLSKNGTPTPEQNQMTKLVRDTVGLTQGDPNSSKAEGMQHLDDAASLDNHKVDPKSSNAGDDQVRIEIQFGRQKTFCIKLQTRLLKLLQRTLEKYHQLHLSFQSLLSPSHQLIRE